MRIKYPKAIQEIRGCGSNDLAAELNRQRITREASGPHGVTQLTPTN